MSSNVQKPQTRGLLTVNRLLGVLCDKGLLTQSDVDNINTSVRDLERHAVPSTAPGAGITSKAVNDLFDRIEGLKRRR